MRPIVALLVCAALAVADQRPASDFARGVQLQRSGDLHGARAAYEAALRANPRSVEALSNLGMVQLTLGRHEEAIQCFSQALAIQPELPGVRQYLGLAYYKGGEFARARTELETVIRKQPRDAKSQHLLGLVRLGEGDLEHAVTELNKAVLLEPGNVAAAQTLATTWLALRNTAEAKKVLDGPLSRVDTADTRMIRGLYHHATRDYKQSLAHLRSAAELNPQMPTLPYHLARAHLALGDLESAHQQLLREVARNPDSWNANAYLGWVLVKLNRPEEALVPLQEALVRQPEHSALLWTSGVAYAGLRRNDEAILALERAVAIEPDLTPAQVLLGQMYARTGRKEDAVRQKRIIDELQARDRVEEVRRGQAEALPDFGTSRRP
jgi:tetratricopeptide (TPR) repeat protein